jgi:uncharacterized protein YbgA (DUF1722 family)/uncharacterized protein YbbK (DUF523 family)
MDVLGHGLPNGTMAGLNRDDVRPRVGVSSCLLGEAVRFDGGHKRNAFLTEIFGRYVEWVPVCPEVEMGLSTPRDTLRLERAGSDVRMVVPKTRRDHTQAMRAFSARRVLELAGEDLSGYVLKANSPSCGMERVRVSTDDGSERTGRGLFAEELIGRNPLLPVEEEGRLSDVRIRENFIERVFAYRRLKALFSERWNLGDVVAFHTVHKLTLLAHSPAGYTSLGRLVARGKEIPRRELRTRYERTFMGVMKCMATRPKHAHVLHHILGYFSQDLDDGPRHELLDVIEDYRNELVPLAVPLYLVRGHVRALDIEYLRGQTYLDPYPKELMPAIGDR